MLSIRLVSVNSVISSVLLSVVALISPSNVSAEPITLTFEAHGFTVSGEFLEYSQDGYVLLTENGTLRVPAAMVSCEGAACVEPAPTAAIES